MKILELLKESISRVPYGIRWLCKATKLLVQVRENINYSIIIIFKYLLLFFKIFISINKLFVYNFLTF